ncbi:HAD-IA family hydrolase [Qipengyuania thermophila]|uniref:HAD-IA family hydrolase n=1 Tax=Qipengyuania thermophila TaxID=2509361 RepID=UPI0036F22A3A
MRLAVFDCDGTLVDGEAMVCQAMRAAFAGEALAPPADAAVRQVVGLSLPLAIARLAPDQTAARRSRLAERYRSAFAATRDGTAHQEPLYPGIEDLVRDLRNSGWTLGIATGKSSRGAAATLAAHGLAGSFATVQTADHHPSKPHPSMLFAAMADAGAEPSNTVMIGDTVFDMHMAVSAGARAVGVAWGYHTRADLLAAGATAVADRAQDLGALLAAF